METEGQEDMFSSSSRLFLRPNSECSFQLITIYIFILAFFLFAITSLLPET